MPLINLLSNCILLSLNLTLLLHLERKDATLLLTDGAPHSPSPMLDPVITLFHEFREEPVLWGFDNWNDLCHDAVGARHASAFLCLERAKAKLIHVPSDEPLCAQS